MMWWRKRKELEKRCNNIAEYVEEYVEHTKKELCKVLLKKMDMNDLVECEVCGCLLTKWMAIKGKGEVRIRDWHWEKSEYIYHPYYCKIHAPKEEEKEENKSLDK